MIAISSDGEHVGIYSIAFYISSVLSLGVVCFGLSCVVAHSIWEIYVVVKRCIDAIAESSIALQTSLLLIFDSKAV